MSVYEVLPWEGEEFTLQHQSNQFLQAVKQALAECEQLKVDGEDSFKAATSLYKKVREIRKKIDGWRLEATAPMREKTAAINDRAKDFTDPLQRVESIINLKINSYHRLVEDQQKKAADELREAQELFEIDTPIMLPEVPKTLRGDGANAHSATVKSFRVTDPLLVPREFLMVDEDAIKKAIKDGRRVIPGVEIFDEQITKLRIR